VATLERIYFVSCNCLAKKERKECGVLAQRWRLLIFEQELTSKIKKNPLMDFDNKNV